MSFGSDDFADFCEQNHDEAYDHFRAVIQRAKKRASSEISKKFVRSCERFLKENLILTEAQLGALESVGTKGFYQTYREKIQNDFDDTLGDFDTPLGRSEWDL